MPILVHPLMQRLHRIRQLSFSYLKFPGARHTRFSHSLGVCRNMEVALRIIFERNSIYSERGRVSLNLNEQEKRRLILKGKLLGLIHDMGHGPFAHVIDAYVAYRRGGNLAHCPRPDKLLLLRYIDEDGTLGEIINGIGFDPEEIKRILDPRHREELASYDPYDPLLADLIDSPIDVDRMDYLVRDAYFTGLPIGSLNIDLLMHSMVAFHRDDAYYLAYKYDGLRHIEHFLYARDMMYINCYDEPMKVGAERMIVKALDNFVNTLALRDRELDEFLDKLLLLGDEELLDIILFCSNENQICHKLALSIRKGNIYRLLCEYPVPEEFREEVMKERDSAYLICYDRANEWERRLTQDIADNKRWQVLIHIPMVSLLEPTEVQTSIMKEESGRFSCEYLGNLSESVVSGLLHLLRRTRLKIRIYVGPDLTGTDLSRIRARAERRFSS